MQDEVFGVEQRFSKLRGKRIETDDRWQRHSANHIPALSGDAVADRQKRYNLEVERKGHKLIQDLKLTMTDENILSVADIESQIKKAQWVAIAIDRLVFELEDPKPFRRL
jgi:hypothetical protein